MTNRNAPSYRGQANTLPLNNTLRHVCIGNQRFGANVVNVLHRGCRTQAQFDAIAGWHAAHPFAFWCGNPFSQEYPGQEFKCSFSHEYYDNAGDMHALWVTPTGRITYRNVSADRRAREKLA